LIYGFRKLNFWIVLLEINNLKIKNVCQILENFLCGKFSILAFSYSRLVRPYTTYWKQTPWYYTDSSSQLVSLWQYLSCNKSTLNFSLELQFLIHRQTHTHTLDVHRIWILDKVSHSSAESGANLWQSGQLSACVMRRTENVPTWPSHASQSKANVGNVNSKAHIPN